MSAKKAQNESEIISKYMDVVLMTGKKPESIYKFAKELKIEEEHFYKFFTSFESLERRIFIIFFENSLQLLEQNEAYNDFETRDKLLSLYFTFVEMITANRSYVIHSLEEDKMSLKGLKKLSGLRDVFIKYMKTLDFDTIDFKQEKIQKIQDRGIEEFYWMQFLLILKFWMDDTSPSFEKTDVFIEKSVHASFDAMNTKPAKSIIDFGKFILKEKMDLKL